uniref:Uncharacterized protein n=1 Tax=Rhizophora mucronata TaxID=61149 RepID=A0A2P2Q119_RHIMU
MYLTLNSLFFLCSPYHCNSRYTSTCFNCGIYVHICAIFIFKIIHLSVCYKL